MKRAIRRLEVWLGLRERHWWDEIDCGPVVVLEGDILARVLSRIGGAS